MTATSFLRKSAISLALTLLSTAGASRAIEVIVRSADRLPVQGATIVAQETSLPDTDLWTTCTTGSDGRCSVTLHSSLPDRLRISASRKDFVTVFGSWIQDRNPKPIPTVHEFTLPVVTTLGGVVQDEEGRPIDGAHLRLGGYIGEYEANNNFELRTVTDKQGRWSLVDAPSNATSYNAIIWHSDFAPQLWEKQADATPDRMKQQTAIHTLRDGKTVNGRVLDPGGKPVPGALVEAGHLRAPWYPTPQTTIDEEGKFTITGLPGNPLPVMVRAPGYAIGIAQAAPDRGTSQVEVRLQPEEPVRLRVNDSTGSPVKGALVACNYISPHNAPVEWSAHTDEDGRALWKEAPREKMSFSVRADGYAILRGVQVQATERDSSVTLQRPLRLRGRVVDAETSKPVQGFRIAAGRRSFLYKHPDTFSDAFEVTLFEQLNHDLAREEYVLKVEADRYIPKERSVLPEAVTSEVVIAMKRGSSVRGKVLGTDGKPASGVQVAIGGVGTFLNLHGGLLAVGSPRPVMTNNRGEFELPALETPLYIAAFSERGYAESSWTSFTLDNVLALRPWATIEGEIVQDGEPYAGESVALSHPTSFQTITSETGKPMIINTRPSHGAAATTDANGRFRFLYVAPGPVTVEPKMRLPRRTVALTRRTVELEPGELLKLEIGKGEGTVTGCINKGSIAVPLSNDYVSIKRMEGSTSASTAAKSRQEQWNAAVSEDGSFRVTGVLPGNYRVRYQLHEYPESGKAEFPTRVLRQVSRDIEVPPDDGVVELGNLKLHNVGRVGDVAPNFRTTSHDGTEIHLAALRGKYVLLDFWATGCGPCVRGLPKLKELHEQYRDTGRLEMIGLSLDEEASKPAKLLQEKGCHWTHSWIGGEFSGGIAGQYGVIGIPDMVFIDPEGRVLERGHDVEAIARAMEKVLTN